MRKPFEAIPLRPILWPAILIVAGVVVLAAKPLIPASEKLVSAIDRAAHVAILVGMMLALASLLEFVIQRALSRTRSRMARSGLIRGVSRTIAYGLGAVMVLSELGIQVGPLLTALGVGGVAFALAFKDTAENMFSGINLLIDSSVEVGDRIRVESGQEGVVQDIGWRTSKINLGEEGILIIPNAKLAQNITIRKKKRAEPGGESTALQSVS